MEINEQVLHELRRIADALERLARGNAPDEPNLVRPIGEFRAFDWSSIGASVVQADEDGPTHLERDGLLWTRRSPQNKFDPAIWFSRAAGKDAEGNVQYLRLITFRKIGEAEPVPARARQAAEATPARNGTAVVDTAGEGQWAPKGPKDWTTWWTVTAPHYGLTEERAKAVLKECNNDAVAAWKMITFKG